ncbi:MAG: hypothetical protein APF84_11210 [Gracilibacter sp. BRH_c7a]|nr:MAG: hypothetical protein APF84_11210 [Gracilibacter sp. BRH_c7a]
MGDNYPIVKVAAVQSAPVFLNREATTEKACSLIREAGENGARVIAFPESYIPAHPIWFHFHPGTDSIATKLSVELFKNSVEIPGPEVEALGAAAREANAYVIMGICEKIPNTFGTMFNTQIFIGPDGTLLGKHQKIMPTVGERLVHKGGYGDTFMTFNTEFGPISGLVCGENTNPLAIFALTAEGTRIHIMGWPNHFPKISRPMRERVETTSKTFAEMTKAFVISSCAIVDEDIIKILKVNPEQEEFLRNPLNSGGSSIVSPDTKVLAGPMGNEEGIIYADIDLEVGVKMKIRHDFAGHYNRPDIFHLTINRSVPTLYSESGSSEINFSEITETLEIK